MQVKLAYGKEGLAVNIPDENLMKILHMNPIEPLQNVEEKIAHALTHSTESKPLAEIARGRSSAVIVISDITRPVPNQLLLPPLLKTIEEAGVPHEKITILIATGIHRPNLGEELEQLVGKDVANHYNCVNHYSEDSEIHEYLCNVADDIPVYLNKHYLQADLKILTGLVELHLMAGYSGGRKAVLPGITSLETMKRLHGYRMIQKDELCNGRLQGNPFHEAAVKVARLSGADFILNVTLNENREVTGVFAGELEAAHEQACALIERCALVPIEEQADIVITTGGGYPLDKTLYQSIKGQVGALEAVKEGGTIILATQNDEGAGSADFIALLRQLEDPMHFYRLTQGPDYVAKDQWMIQELVNGLHRCELLYYTGGISENDLRDFLITPIPSVEKGIEQALARHGSQAKILVIPEGPYVIPKPPTPVKGLYSWQMAGAEA